MSGNLVLHPVGLSRGGSAGSCALVSDRTPQPAASQHSTAEKQKGCWACCPATSYKSPVAQTLSLIS